MLRKQYDDVARNGQDIAYTLRSARHASRETTSMDTTELDSPTSPFVTKRNRTKCRAASPSPDDLFTLIPYGSMIAAVRVDDLLPGRARLRRSARARERRRLRGVELLDARLEDGEWERRMGDEGLFRAGVLQ